METIFKTEFVVGWSTKQANGHVRRTTRYYDENEQKKALAKFNVIINKPRTLICYLNKRIEYSNGSVGFTRLYGPFCKK